MVEKPSDLNNKDPSRLTRRRVMKLAAAAGFGASTVATLTSDDIKAAASDEVTIAFDVSGRNKKQVPADWYNRVQDAKRVNEQIQQKFAKREGVHSIGMSSGGGPDGSDNPHVQVTLDEDSDQKDERRGEIPERKDGIRIDVDEQHVAKDTTDSHDEDSCNDETQDVSSLPGGTKLRLAPDDPGFCTNGPRFINGTSRDWLFGWSTAAHCVGCEAVGQPVYHGGDPYANVIWADFDRDIAYLERRSDTSPESEIVEPSNHSNSVHISDTVSESGMATITGNSNYEVFTRGVGGCTNRGGRVSEYNTVYFSFGNCIEYLQDQYVVGYDHSSSTPPEGGDSGATPFVEDNGNYFVIGSHTGHPNTSESYGPQGYTLKVDYDIWWSDI